MADGTKIEWTEATWNPITGCSVLSPGCTNCYAMKLSGTRLAHHPSRAGLTHETKAGPVWTGEVRFNGKWLDQPLRWRRPRIIFVCAHGDLFHESVPDEWIDRVFAVMALCPQHTFQVLTKRSARMREYLANGFTPANIALAVEESGAARQQLEVSESRLDAWPLPNAWLGVSVEDQARAEGRIPDLLATPAAVRWLSCEPLVGPVDLVRLNTGRHINGEAIYLDALVGELWAPSNDGFDPRWPGIDWIVCGGESGPGGRPMHPDWARSLRDQCAAADVPFFFKQWGEWGPDVRPESANEPPYRDPVMDGAGPCGVLVDGRWQFYPNGYAVPLELCSGHGEFVYRLGKRRNGRMLDGRLHDAMPRRGDAPLREPA